MDDRSRGDASLAVGRPRQRDQLAGSGDHVLGLYHVSDRPDIGIIGLHEFVHLDTTTFAQIQSRAFKQSSFRPHANRQNNQVSLQLLSRGYFNLEASICVFFKALNTSAQTQTHTIFFQSIRDHHGHFRIERRHYLVGHFNQGDLQPPVSQIFRHLQADESPSHHDRASRVLNRVSNFSTVRNGAQYENSR